MQAYLLIVVYSVLIVSGSLIGGWLPSRINLTHIRMQATLSFVGGLMLGIALLHLLPHGVVQCNSLDLVIGSTLFGLLFMFFLIRTFHFHQHGPTTHEHDEHHCHHPDHGHTDEDGGVHELSWTGVALGLSIHTLIDGIALGTAVMADAAHETKSVFYGLGVFLAVLFHKPLDALSITTLMVAAGWPARICQLVNFGFALMCPLGAVVAVLMVNGLAGVDVNQSRFIGMVLGFSAGVFLCISLSDLLPEVQFHRHDRLKLSTALLLGVAAAYAIGLIEGEHAHAIHDHPPDSAESRP